MSGNSGSASGTARSRRLSVQRARADDGVRTLQSTQQLALVRLAAQSLGDRNGAPWHRVHISLESFLGGLLPDLGTQFECLGNGSCIMMLPPLPPF